MVYVLLDINEDWFYPINRELRASRGNPERKWTIMATRTVKTVMVFAIIVGTILIGGIFVTSDDAFAGSSSGLVIVRSGFDDDRFVVRRPFFNPFLFDDDFFFDDDDFFFERDDDERPFFGRFERDNERPFFRRFERDDD